MFLKRIELSGFKSFADRTELEFVNGITAVVGPNGSGKSNISDGIRWVLGEQSARTLRGGKMEDVIFAGSDGRKAVNYSEVSLTLDNADRGLSLDYSEVTVTRRVHRSGESEYLLNKQTCRLKDITELFMDTGIGREAYSIIGQGRIEEILSTKSEDRRGIFEEASGIVKYKSRKKDAEKKLNETEQNLLRIHDLVTELESQIEPLQEQSEIAEKYKILKEQLKNVEISLYVHQIETLYQLWTQNNQGLKVLQDEQIALATIVNQHDASLEKHRWETKRLDELLESLHQLMLQTSEQFDQSAGLGEVLKERQGNLIANSEQLEQSLGVIRKRMDDKQTELVQFQAQMEFTEEQLAKNLASFHEEEAKLVGVVGGLNGQAAEQLKGQLLETLNGIAQCRNEIRYLEQQLESISRRDERLEEEQLKWKAQLELIAERKVVLTQKIKLTTVEIDHIRDRFLAHTEQMNAKKNRFEEIQATIRRWEQKLHGLVSRRDTLLELQNDYDGFLQGVKEVLKAQKSPDGLKGIHGAVAELIEVPADVELAIETALGGVLQNIVVTNESNGREAISFLKKRQLGRATFLPLNVIKARFIADNERQALQGIAGFVGIALHLVKFDSKYEAVMASLLGNVIIAKTLEEANHLAARCQYRYRVVTLEGDVVHPGGSMTGGSQHKKSASLLGRQRQITEIATEMAQAESQLLQLQAQAAEAKTNVANDHILLEQLREQGETKRMEEQQFIAELNPLDQESRNVNDQLFVTDSEHQTLQQEAEQFVAKKELAQAKLERHLLEEDELQLQIHQAELTRKESESVKDELQVLLTELKVKSAAIEQEQKYLIEQKHRLQMDFNLLADEYAAGLKQLGSLQKEKENNEAAFIQQTEKLNDQQIKKRNLSEQTDFTRAERAQWLHKLEQAENETREQREKLKQVAESIHQIEMKSTRTDVELDYLLKKLAEEYELSFELAKARYPLPENAAFSQKQVKELKNELADLGEVNLGAIEEYARVNERFTFLSEQKQDLMEAKSTLYQVIREMDEEMSKRFRQAFEKIRTQFSLVFAKLFGGGHADLILAEPEQLLDTGIEIIAQPPGKKLQNLQLLSGGERALTAIALLFAILRIKPVPFCVLDEVEAALDEANVTRFAQYLREFSQQTQFIVVTHRKGTMEEADVLYGVTMEEGGVSKLVSVRLDDHDEEPVSA